MNEGNQGTRDQGTKGTRNRELGNEGTGNREQGAVPVAAKLNRATALAFGGVME
jgi:hypothetical protein